MIPYSAANASAFFKRFLLVAFLISVAVVWFVIYNVQPSSSCGPFRDVAQGVYEYIIQIIQDTKLYPLKDVSSPQSALSPNLFFKMFSMKYLVLQNYLVRGFRQNCSVWQAFQLQP